eukprot:3313881-Alexandrium_andersonii.AAC.1
MVRPLAGVLHDAEGRAWWLEDHPSRPLRLQSEECPSQAHVLGEVVLVVDAEPEDPAVLLDDLVAQVGVGARADLHQ